MLEICPWVSIQYNWILMSYIFVFKSWQVLYHLVSSRCHWVFIYKGSLSVNSLSLGVQKVVIFFTKSPWSFYKCPYVFRKCPWPVLSVHKEILCVHKVSMSVHKTSVSVHRHRLPSQLIDDDVCGNSARNIKVLRLVGSKKVPNRLKSSLLD